MSILGLQSMLLPVLVVVATYINRSPKDKVGMLGNGLEDGSALRQCDNV